MERVRVLVVVHCFAVLVLAGCCGAGPMPGVPDGVVPVRCVAVEGDTVLCHPEPQGTEARGRDARLFGRLGFLTGLHLGGAISSSGSLSASHSLNVFGKVMNTALSVSYGPNGHYQGPGYPGGRPPLNPVGPGFGYEDDPVSTTANPNKGHEATAVLGLGVGVGVGVSSKAHPPSNSSLQGGPDGSQTQQGAGPAADAPVHEVPDERPIGDNVVPDGGPAEEVIGEETEPPPPPQQPGLHFSAERRAQLEALARVRGPQAPVPTVENQRRLFLKHHNKHVAAFNQHYTKYKGDVSKVAIFSRMNKV